MCLDLFFFSAEQDRVPHCNLVLLCWCFLLVSLALLKGLLGMFLYDFLGF